MAVRRGVVIAGVLVALGYGVFSLVHTPSDAAMLARFQTHRAVFDQLLQMFVADQQDMYLGTLGRTWVDLGDTPARRRSPPHDLVQFDAASYRGFIGPEKAWVYTAEPLTWPLPIRLTDGDTAAYHFPPPCRAGCSAKSADRSRRTGISVLMPPIEAG